MTTVSAGRSTSNRRRVVTALGTVAAAVTGVATVLVGTQVIRVTPPDSDTSPYCSCAYECVQPLANPLSPNSFSQLTPSGLATWSSQMPCWQVSGSNAGRAI
jgi:hypothetical protein